MPQFRLTTLAASLSAAILLLIAPGLRAAPPAPSTVEGVLTLVWVDAAPDRIAHEETQYWLHPRGGGRLLLEVPPELRGAIHRHDRRAVRIHGRALPPAAARDGGPPPAPRFRVAGVDAAPAAGGTAAAAQPAFVFGQPVRGRQPWINLLCKFQEFEPQREPSYFGALFASTRPGMDYYWKEQSNGQMSVAGSTYTQWKTLPRPYEYYVYDMGGNGVMVMDGQRTMDDCLALHDPEVNYPGYAGVNMIFNGSLGCCSYGGGAWITKDGVERLYGITWLADWGWTQHTLVAHEMGHGFGLMHSRGNNQTYRNLWDVMSDIWHNCHLATDSVLGCLGQHTIGYHKHQLGWVPEETGVYHANPGTRQTIRLERLERPAAGLYHLARIPIRASSTHYYTVEARRRYSFDRRLPGTSVVIHEVDTSFPESANVVDGDDNGDPYDAGTRWLVGETFRDDLNGISVSVDSTDGAQGFMVTIERQSDIIFADTFESGDVSAWSGGKLDGGDVSVTTAARLAGTYGLQVLIDDNNQAHLTDHTPQAEHRYRASFRFDPNGIRMADNDRFTIFGAYTDSPFVAMIELRRSNGEYQLRAVARQDNGSQAASPFIFIADQFSHEVVLEWQAASGPGMNDGQLRFLIDESEFADFNGLDTDTLRVERSLLGAVTGVDSGTRGTIYLDHFRSSHW